MEMGVVVNIPQAIDFNFDSGCSTPFMTAPSSPQRFGNFFLSAPTSPTKSRAAAFYRDFNNLVPGCSCITTTSTSLFPFGWEERPGFPKSNGDSFNDDINEDFEFNFSGQLDRTSLPADELFDCGKIKPLKPPPRLQVNENSVPTNIICSPRSKISQGKKMVQEVFSPRNKKDFDPFEAALKETRVLSPYDEWSSRDSRQIYKEQNRGRSERFQSSSSLNFIRKGARSLSPLRASDILLQEEENSSNTNPTSFSTTASPPKPTSSSILSSISFSKGYRKWRLKHFLLFRSASEGRATDKDPLRRAVDRDAKCSSFRSVDSSGLQSLRRKGHVSAHELHYTVNRAVSEEMKKKTILPYKHGLLGCLGFNPGMRDISRGLGF